MPYIAYELMLHKLRMSSFRLRISSFRAKAKLKICVILYYVMALGEVKADKVSDRKAVAVIEFAGFKVPLLVPS